MSPVKPIRPKRVTEILAEALDLFGKHWARLMAIAAIVIVPFTILQYYVWDLVRASSPAGDLGEVSRAAAASGVLGIVGLFIYQVMIGAVARSAAGMSLGKDIEIAEAYRFGYARMWSILLVSVLVGLAVTGGFILLVIPGFFVMTRLFASVPALVVEGKRGRAALRRSWSLVEGRGWRIFGIILLVGLITGLVSSVFALATDQGWFGQAVAASISGVVTGPFVALVGILVYLDLRARQEHPTVTTVRKEFEAAGAGVRGGMR